MTAFWPTSEPRAPGRGRDEAATEGWLVMERWDDTCSPAARARRWPCPAIFTSRRAHVLDALQVEAPSGDGHAGGAALRRQHHHRHRAAHGGGYPAVRASPGGGHRERDAVRDLRDRGTGGIAHGVRERRGRASRAGRRSDHRHQLRPDDTGRGGPTPSHHRPAQRRQLDPRDARRRPDDAHRNPLGVSVTQPATSTEPRAVLRDHVPVATRPATGRPTVVIVGAGFGGLRAARALRKAPVNVVLVDRHNYHLFQPLLYQVATAGLEPEEIARPVRAILRRQSNTDVRMTEGTGLDAGGKRIDTTDGPIAYDYLILAVGGQTNYFGLESVPRHGFGLKDIPEAIRIRNHVLHAFERAMIEANPERRRAELTFVVVGGGPTGVEMAGALSELIRLVLVKDYPRLNVKDVRVLLLEATDRLLAAMPDRLGDAAAKILWRKKHVEVRFGAAVQDFDGARITLKSGEVIPARTLIWAAGAKAVSLTATLGLTTARQGRVAVTPELQAPDHPEVYVIGDAAYLEHDGAPLPMMAPVALQMADTATANIARRLRDEPPRAFRFKDPGSLATIGRNAAVAYLGGVAFKGFAAWVVWLIVHIIQLIGFRNKLFVLMNWAWDYFFYERAARLITKE